MPPEPPARPGLPAAAHGALIALLIAARPLVWDEDPTQLPCLAYLALIGVALGVALGESWVGERRRWRWSWTGALFALLIVVLLPAAARSPLPVQGWSLWLTLAAQLGLAGYLMQTVPGRERAALAALGAGLIGEALIAVMQWPWVLPAMAAEQRSGGFAGIFSAETQGDLAERIENGGLFGTFTQANALAAYLLLVGPLLCAAALARGLSRVARLVAVAALVLGIAAFLGTASKGACIALAGAGACVWWWYRPGRSRWLGPVAAAAALALVLAAPALRERLRPSAEVRVGYWQAAVEFVRERPLPGWGLRGFGEQMPRALPLWAEFSLHAHNEPLEAAAEAGLPAALLLVGLLALMPLVRRTGSGEPASAEPEAPSPAVPFLLGFGIVYLCGLGLLDTNTGWWPGGKDDWLVRVAWGAAVAAAMSTGYAALLRLPLPPPWAFALALGALALHCVIDFDLHSGAIVGTAVACAVLAPGTRRAIGSDGRRLPLPILAAATLVVVAYAGLVIASSVEAARLRDARAIVDDLDVLAKHQTRSRTEAQEVLADLARRSGQTEPPADALERRDLLHALLIGAFACADRLADGDYELRTSLVAAAPPGREREPTARLLAEQRPASAAVQRLWAQDAGALALAAERGADHAAAVAHWHEAIERMRRSCALAPTMLRARAALVDLLGEAAQHLPEEAEQLKKEEAEERKRIDELQRLVNPRNRL